MQKEATPMCKIAELTMLLREGTELPDDLKLATEEFREDWNFVLSGDARWLDKKIRRCRWYLLWIDEGSLRSGVGNTSQEAIAGALKLALRHVSARFNAAEVEHIELKQYPWFFIAKVKVYPYQIQQSAPLPVADGTLCPMPAELIASTTITFRPEAS
jgi:hypothetical protein